MGFLSKLFGTSESDNAPPFDPTFRPTGYDSYEEAEQVAEEYRNREGVAGARILTSGEVIYVHVDEQREDGSLGDIVTVTPTQIGRVEMEPPAEKRPWWQVW